MLPNVNKIKFQAIPVKKNTLYTWLKVKVSYFFRKGLVMVSQVGLNTSVNMALPALKNNNNAATNTNGSLFTNYNSIPVNDYSNDVFMSNMNFSQLASGAAAQGTNQAAALQTQQQTFEGGVKAVTDTQSEPEKSNKFKILGVLGDALTPVALKAKDLIKAGK